MMLPFESKRVLWPRMAAVAFMGSIVAGCGQTETASTPEFDVPSEVVARVGDRTITARQFQLNYEFGFSALKKGPDRKFSYLQSMVDELLLSMEGYRLGLDDSERVQNLESELLQGLLFEELLRTEVTEGISVSEDEIRDGVTRANVRWKFRFWAEDNLRAAQRVYDSMQVEGHENVVRARLRDSGVRLTSQDFETDYLTWLDTPPELLEVISDLSLGELSDPIRLNDSYYIIQMTDIRRGALSDFDYARTSEQSEQLLFQRKLKKQTGLYVAGFMTEKDVVMKATPFRALAEALTEWQLGGEDEGPFRSAIDMAGDDSPALTELRRRLGEVLISFEGGRWTLGEFIERVDAARLLKPPGTPRQFRAHLKREIGLALRNDLMAEEAVSKGLLNSAEVQRQLRSWRDKWVSEELRWQISGLVESLPDKLAHLRRTNSVHIYEAVLDSIPVTDFEKSRWADVFVFKNSSKSAAIPTVAPSLAF